MSYQAFIQSCVSACHCCPECQQLNIPCDGTMAGGMCDRMCWCDDGGEDDRCSWEEDE